MTTQFDQIRETAHLWRARLDDGVSATERAEFNRWMAADPRHAEAFAESEIVWKALGAVEFDATLSHVPNANRLSVLAWLTQRWQYRVGYALAMLLVFALGFYWWLLPQPLRYTTAIGEIKMFELSDGSQVTLGARSQLKVVITDQHREAWLYAGDAYFSVQNEQARPFVLNTALAEVRVTGTEFDIQHQADVLHVAVAEGSVEVVKSGDYVQKLQTWLFDDTAEARVQLNALEAVKVSNATGLGQLQPIRATQLAAWRRGQLSYLHASLAEIIDDVNRYTPWSIALDTAVRDLRLSGTFNADDIDALLATLEVALPVRLVEENRRRVLVASE